VRVVQRTNQIPEFDCPCHHEGPASGEAVRGTIRDTVAGAVREGMYHHFGSKCYGKKYTCIQDRWGKGHDGESHSNEKGCAEWGMYQEMQTKFYVKN
jgi:hypothetical protein